MALALYDTLRRERVTFEPLELGRARMYTCGPTVYDYAHIGTLRTFLFEDLLRRVLEARGYEVTQVMNLTDVDDKIIRKAHSRRDDRRVHPPVHASLLRGLTEGRAPSTIRYDRASMRW
jgi:cysteinyl-tRNA synthetase